MTVKEAAVIEIIKGLRELTPEEHNHLYECLRKRIEWANCTALDFDPMLRREKILGFQKEVENLLEAHGLEPWQYVQFTIITKKGVTINTREIMNYYGCYIDESEFQYIAKSPVVTKFLEDTEEYIESDEWKI